MPSETENLILYKPDPGETGVADELNQNWTTIDHRFDDAIGHLHSGRPGEGPKIPVTSLAASGVPSTTTFLRGDGSWQAGTGGGASSLDELSDVTIATPAGGQALINNGAGQWTNQAIPPDSWTSITGKPATFPPATHQHAAADTTSGVFATARLATGTPSVNTFARGDGQWQPVNYSQIQDRPGQQTVPAYVEVWNNLSPAAGVIDTWWDLLASGVPAGTPWVTLFLQIQATGAVGNCTILTANPSYPLVQIAVNAQPNGYATTQGMIFTMGGYTTIHLVGSNVAKAWLALLTYGK